MKPIIFVGFVLTACGGSGGGSSQTPAASTTATQTATATATATSTSTTAATPTTKVADIVATLASVVLCKPLAQQPAAVQALIASPLAGNPQTNVCGIDTTCYSNKEAGSYSDGTDTIQWGLIIDTASGLVVVASYQVDSKPAVHNNSDGCTQPKT